MSFQPRQRNGFSCGKTHDLEQHSVSSVEEIEAGLSSEFSDRSCSARKTLARLRPHFGELGISRLGDLTGLDNLGIPVAMAVRPNSNSLSVSLGKGPDSDSAFISAAMEAAETSVAENVAKDMVYCSIEELKRFSRRTLMIEDIARCHPRLVSQQSKLAWVSGVDLKSGEQTLVPWSLVGLDHRKEPEGYNDAFYVASDGLASGNTYDEAVFHGLCELIERDALFKFQFADKTKLSASEFAATGEENVHLPELLRRIEGAGLNLRLFHMHSDTGIPAFLALLEAKHHRPSASEAQGGRCGGCGCHPDPGRAIVKAVTEAAQARLALVAGARDDIRPEHYSADEFMALGKPAALPPAPTVKHQLLQENRSGGLSMKDAVQDLVDRLDAIGICQPVSVELDASQFGIHVVRVIADKLQVPLEGARVQITSRGFAKMQEAAQ